MSVMFARLSMGDCRLWGAVRADRREAPPDEAAAGRVGRPADRQADAEAQRGMRFRPLFSLRNRKH